LRGVKLTWNARKKKFMFQADPDTQYLLITVILMEARQYARMEIAGLFVILETGTGNPPDRPEDIVLEGGDNFPFVSVISTAKTSSLFLPSIFVDMCAVD
jgi:hypothetical protein